jgi:hypothetical protein
MASKPDTTDLRALWATTKEKIGTSISDGITENIPLLMEIKEKKNFVESEDGGRQFNEPAIVGESNAVGGYRKGSVLNVAEQEGIDDFEYNPAFFYGSVYMDGPALAMNAGEAAAVRLLSARIQQAKDSMANKLDEFICQTNQLSGSASASDQGSQFGWLGLRDLVPDVQTQDIPGTGVDKTKYAKAQSAVISTSIASATAWNTAAAGRTVVQQAFNAASFGLKHPTFSLFTRTLWDAFQLSLQANEKFENSQIGGKDAKVGYPHLTYMADCRVTWGDNLQAGHFYMLNPEFMKMKILKAKNFKMGDFIEAYNVDQEVAKITLGGQMTVNAPRYHSVYTGGGF